MIWFYFLANLSVILYSTPPPLCSACVLHGQEHLLTHCLTKVYLLPPSPNLSHSAAVCSGPPPPHSPLPHPVNRTITYTREQLLAARDRPSPLDPSLNVTLRRLRIGRDLPHCRTARGGRRKRRAIPTVSVHNFPHLSHRSRHNHTRSVNHGNLIHVSMAPRIQTTTNILLTVFNAQSLGTTCQKKRSAVNEFILSNDIDILCVTETWFKESGDEPKLRDLAPAGYTTKSFPRSTTTCGGGIAFVISDKLLPYCSFVSSFAFQHRTFELVHLKLSLPSSPITNIFGIYRPVPSKKNKLTPSMFINELPDFLEFVNNLPGTLLLIGDFNFHFNKPTVGYVPEVLEILDTFQLQQSVNQITNKQGNIVDWVVYRDGDHLLQSTTVDNNLASDHYAVKCVLNII